MQIKTHKDKTALGIAAAREGAEAINTAIDVNGQASVILATGASQFDTLDNLVNADIDWSRVTAFHLDEYVGIDPEHKASFRRYLKERVIDRLPKLAEFILVAGDVNDLGAELSRINQRIAKTTIDVCFAGIGENCHLAFNDPPADFAIETPYISVNLDLACRRQQLGEGWFATIDDVPLRAISMSIRQIMKSKKIILSIPDHRKAAAVRNAIKSEVSVNYPASILQQHRDVTFHLDPQSAAQLTEST